MPTRLNLQLFKNIAKLKGGECLSNHYKNQYIKMRWRCLKGHIWEAIPKSIKKGHWCPYCAGRKEYTIKCMREIAQSRGGQCLSEEYKGIFSKLTWKCKNGHIWKTSPQCIMRGYWCRFCAIKQRGINHRLSIESIKKLAEERGGKCVDTNYKNSSQKLRWQCAYGHIWKATTNKIKVGKWCPICTKSISERLCRAYFEGILQEKFPTVKLPWLISPKGYTMDLDGYNEKLKLAFEYMGVQHYKKIKFFNQKRTLDEIKKYDKLKEKLCLKHNIKLIIIDYTIKPHNLKDYIIKRCEECGFKIKEDIKEINPYLTTIDSERHMKIVRMLSKNRGGSCLSKQYKGAFVKLNFRCKGGHEWWTTPVIIKGNHWCPECKEKLPSKVYVTRLEDKWEYQGEIL